MPWLESIAYALARGAVRAYLDALAEAQHVTPEHLGPDDARHAQRLRQAVAALPPAAAGPGGPACPLVPPPPADHA